MIRVYILGPIHNTHRRHMYPLLKPFEKENPLTKEELFEMYSCTPNMISKVATPEEAQVLIVPMSWNFYTDRGSLNEIKKLLKSVTKHKKPILSFLTGDFGVVVPDIPYLKVLRQSGATFQYKSTHQGMPSFIEDPLKKHFNTSEISILPFTSKPSIGFCGQAPRAAKKHFQEQATTWIRNIKFKLGIRNQLPQPVLSTSKLRYTALENLKKAPFIANQFIYRDKYRAGVKTKAEKLKTTQEFYSNIESTQYTLCVRGAGNFSVRFYETLALGRIPVYLDTHGFLPLPKTIDWDTCMVRVPYKQRHRIAEFVRNYHEKHTEESFSKRQLANRKLWEDSLTLGTFFNQYINSILKEE